MGNRTESVMIDRVHGGSWAEGSIDFSTSLNPLGVPNEAVRAYHDAAALIGKYPTPYPRRLEARIAAWLDVDPEAVIAGNGSTQLIYLLSRVLRLQAPFVVIPTFSEIANALIATGSKPLPIVLRREDNFCFVNEALRNALERGADALFLGRPNSPTGTLVGLEETVALASECARRTVWCVVDEAFIEFAKDPRSVTTFVGSIPKLVVLRSLTKIFAIPGLRLGYLVGPVDLVSRLRDLMEPWSVNAVAEYVGITCLDYAEPFIARTRNMVREQRRRMQRQLGCLSAIRLFPSAANFLMLSVRDESSSGEFGRYMLSKGIVIRDLSALPGCGPGYYRVGVRAQSDNDRLTDAAADHFADRDL